MSNPMQAKRWRQTLTLLAFLITCSTRAQDQVRVWAWSNNANANTFDSTLGNVKRITNEAFVEVHPDVVVTTVRPGNDFPPDDSTVPPDDDDDDDKADPPVSIKGSKGKGKGKGMGRAVMMMMNDMMMAKNKKKKRSATSRGEIKPLRDLRQSETLALPGESRVYSLSGSRVFKHKAKRPDKPGIDSEGSLVNAATHLERWLAVKSCPNCKKKKNWRICRALTCKCACSGRRVLQAGNGRVFNVKRTQDLTNKRLEDYVKRRIMQGSLPNGYKLQVDIERLVDEASPRPRRSPRPTKAPKPPPTLKPTRRPKPTDPPSPAPTAAAKESVPPTPAPVATEQPTPAPVAEETVPPTPVPVAKESVPPTPAPIAKETVPPTPAPIARETVPPTPAPIAKETVPPTPVPTPAPVAPTTTAPVTGAPQQTQTPTARETLVFFPDKPDPPA